jgi:hypothetical protein
VDIREGKEMRDAKGRFAPLSHEDRIERAVHEPAELIGMHEKPRRAADASRIPASTIGLIMSLIIVAALTGLVVYLVYG